MNRAKTAMIAVGIASAVTIIASGVASANTDDPDTATPASPAPSATPWVDPTEAEVVEHAQTALSQYVDALNHPDANSDLGQLANWQALRLATAQREAGGAGTTTILSATPTGRIETHANLADPRFPATMLDTCLSRVEGPAGASTVERRDILVGQLADGWRVLWVHDPKTAAETATCKEATK